MAGYTYTADFPGVDAGSADRTFAGGSEAYIAKLDGELSTLLAATFLGGSNNDFPHTLALDSAGDVYVAGYTDSADFPGVDAGSADRTFGGDFEAYVAKLDGELSTLLAATFLGGSDGEIYATLVLDSTGNVYVAGLTYSPDFPGVDAGSADRTFVSGEAYVAKLDGELSTLRAATFLGGSDGEAFPTLALDGAGNVYVAGTTQSADFPGVDAGSADRTFAGFTEAYVAKLDGELSTLLAATFLGGSSSEASSSSTTTLALDGRGNVYVAGQTGSSDFPGIDAGSADHTFAGTDEAFVAKLNADLSTILAATFLGGSDGEIYATLALDGRGNVYVAGFTILADFPGVGPGSADRIIDGYEAFVAKLNGELSTLLAATFLGGSNNDFATTLALDSTGEVYVAGETSSADFPGVGSGSADRTFVGFNEAFVAKLDPNLSAALCAGRVATIVGTAGDDFLRGTPGPDIIQGLGGNDQIDGLGGNDLVCGGPGNDLLYGATEDDRLYGQAGNDALNGGLGNDRLEGALGNDTLRGGTGNDALSGGGGTDSCDGGSQVVRDTATPDCETVVNVP